MTARRSLVSVTILTTLCALLWGCSSGSSGGGGGFIATPTASSLNGSTLPTSPLGVTLEIAGSGFGDAPGVVRFTQGTATPIDVAPVTSSGWTDTSILVTVPNGLTAPGTVLVTIVRADGPVSVAISLTLVVTPSFSPASIQWGTTQALPVGLRGHMAAAAAVDSSSAWVVVAGGNDGVANLDSTIVASLDANGNLGTWQQTGALPAARAFAGVAVATASNAAVSSGSAFVYVVGGQQAAADAPGGTNTVYRGAINLGNGSVSWAATTALPETRVGARAVVANGYLHVVGGLSANGTPIAAVASAPINSDGTVGAWSEVSDLATPVGFQSTFAFGGFLYAVGGDASLATDPFSASSATAARISQFAPIRNGVVGTWQSTRSLNRDRTKASLLFAFGQLMIYEGAYGNTNFEAVRSSVDPTGALAPFNGQTGGSAPGLNVFNAAGLTSPIFTAGNQPRFLLLGGDLVQTPGSPQAATISTTAP